MGIAARAASAHPVPLRDVLLVDPELPVHAAADREVETDHVDVGHEQAQADAAAADEAVRETVGIVPGGAKIAEGSQAGPP